MHMLGIAHNVRAGHHGSIAVVCVVPLPFFKIGGDEFVALRKNVPRRAGWQAGKRFALEVFGNVFVDAQASAGAQVRRQFGPAAQHDIGSALQRALQRRHRTIAQFECGARQRERPEIFGRFLNENEGHGGRKQTRRR
jgi:hypothetical protein